MSSAKFKFPLSNEPVVSHSQKKKIIYKKHEKPHILNGFILRFNIKLGKI